METELNMNNDIDYYSKITSEKVLTSINDCDTMELMEACFRAKTEDDLKYIESLLEKCENINQQDRLGLTPLMYACLSACDTKEERVIKKKIVELLLENGADLFMSDYLDNEAVIYASTIFPENKTEILDIFSKIIKEKYDYGTTPLMEACFHAKTEDDFDKTKLLLEQCENINQQDRIGLTPLMCACLSTCVTKEERIIKKKIAELLLNNGADVSIIDNNGNNAIFYASIIFQNNKSEIIDLLLRKKNDG